MADHIDYMTDVAVAMFLHAASRTNSLTVVPASDDCFVDRIAVLGPSGGVLDGIAVEDVIGLHSRLGTRQVIRDGRVIWNHEGVLNYR
jgi:hypothetical protein